MQTRFIKYIGFILLIAIIGIFIHPELIGHSHNHKNLEQYDYCNLVSNTIQPQQNEIPKIDFVFCNLLPSFDSFNFSENTNSEIFNIPYPPVTTVSRIIQFESFLI